jgi:hypothetical protein
MMYARFLLLCLVLLAVGFPSLPLAQAGSSTVTNCTYEELLTLINGGGIIQFECSGTILIPVEFVITVDTTVDARGQKVILQNGENNRIFSVSPGAKLTLRGLALTSQTSFLVPGAAIYNRGTLRIAGVTIRDSYAADGSGGAIYNEGSMSIRDSTLDHNTSAMSGGAILNAGRADIVNSIISNNNCNFGGGAIANRGTLRLTNSTLSHNSCDWDGGALYNEGTAVLMNTTFTDNGADGGSIRNEQGALSMTNCTLVRDWSANGTSVIYNYATFTSRNCTFTVDMVDPGTDNIFAQISGFSTFRNTTIIGGPDRSNCVIVGGRINAKGNNQSSDGTCPGFRRLR